VPGAGDEGEETEIKTAEEKELAKLYAEFSDEDKQLAEMGTAHYVALLETEEQEDGQLSQLLETLTEKLQLLASYQEEGREVPTRCGDVRDSS
jgi:ABC-type cobalamin transport system ATPase subunit